MRRVALVLGLAAVVAGAIALHHLRVQSEHCVPPPPGTPGFGVSSSCINQVGLEFVCFAVVMVGLFTFAFALVLMNRDRNARQEYRRPERRAIGTPGEDPELRHRFGSVRLGDGGDESSVPKGPRGLPAREPSTTGAGEDTDDDQGEAHHLADP
ncbi:MAG: hypothetical protein ACHQFZ_05425 [Acidimicrobiales bacterium]